MSEIMAAPTNPVAEWSVVSAMLTKPQIIGEVIGMQLEQRHFSEPATRVIYATAVELYYANGTVDALTVADKVRDELAQSWGLPDNNDVGQALVERVRGAVVTNNVLDHAEIVKRLSNGRQLLDVCFAAMVDINEGRMTPEEIGDRMSAEALQITAGNVKRAELLDWMSTGREYVKHLQRVIAAKQAGKEIGVYTGLSFIDDYTTGIAPGELCFLAGDPGVGKTAVAWRAAEGFATRQMQQDPELRVATLVLSLEMNVYASTMRVVQALTGIDGVRLREGSINKREYEHILQEWKNRENLPMYFNFASNFRLSQMRALIAEGIRRHNVGFVVIDHFRMLDTDRVFTNPNQEDEAKVRFLKENLAKDLNIAVMCLAHTVKVGRGQGGESPRPRLSDLRGSGQIAAHADFVGFLYAPAKHMTEEARREMDIDKSDMELSWQKNRFGSDETALLTFEPVTMTVKARAEA